MDREIQFVTTDGVMTIGDYLYSEFKSLTEMWFYLMGCSSQCNEHTAPVDGKEVH
jgi:hypothetical protein